MNNQRGCIIIFLIMLVFLMGFVNASFNYNSHNIQKNYRTGETIRGSVNLNFSNEPAKNIFTSNIEGEMKLIDLLIKSSLTEGKNFNCSTKNCETTYKLNSPLTSIDFDGEKIVGFKVSGNDIESITSLKVTIKSSLKESCSIPLFIDILAKDERIMTTNSSIDKICIGEKYGCFNITLNEGYGEVEIGEELCETIEIGPGPAFRIGANIKKVGGPAVLVMSIKDGENTYSCTLPELTQTEQRVDCIVSFNTIEKKNVSVCIDNYGAEEDYFIKTEAESPICGNFGRDFEIYVKTLQYDQERFDINSENFEMLYSESLEEYAYDYLKEEYGQNSEGGVICNPCIVPIRLSGAAQTLNLSDIEIRFIDNGLTVRGEQYQRIYWLSEDEPKIEGDNIILNLIQGEFRIPINFTENNFSLKLNNVVVFTDNITLSESFNFDLNTRFAFVGLNTLFEAETEQNISKSIWDFGDGIKTEINEKKIAHRYVKSGEYDIEITLIRNDGVEAIKQFKVIAGNAKEGANITLIKYNSFAINLTKEIKKYPEWLQQGIKEKIDIGSLNRTLAEMDKEFNNATNEEDYSRLLEKLLLLNIPYSISETTSGKSPIEGGFQNIYTKHLEEISKEEVEDDQKLKEMIIDWYYNNYKGYVEFQVLSAVYEKENEEILSSFNFEIEPKKDKESAYFIIDYPIESIHFKEDYGQKLVSEGGGAFIPLSGEKESVEFYIEEEEVHVSDLGAYISPEISRLGVIDDNRPICEEGDSGCEEPFPYLKLIYWMGSIFILFIICYIIVQEWYKKNYENHLFHNKDELYNLLNFIYNSRVAGLSNNEIKKKLKGASWTSEKINYAFNKIDGKRTGLWEIPLFKSMENKRVKNEIERRHGGLIDARFIKQPRF